MNVVNMERGGETASPFVIRNSVIKLACFERTPIPIPPTEALAFDTHDCYREARSQIRCTVMERC